MFQVFLSSIRTIIISEIFHSDLRARMLLIRRRYCLTVIFLNLFYCFLQNIVNLIPNGL